MILRNSNNVCKNYINYNSFYNLVKHTNVSIPSLVEKRAFVKNTGHAERSEASPHRPLRPSLASTLGE